MSNNTIKQHCGGSGVGYKYPNCRRCGALQVRSGALCDSCIYDLVTPIAEGDKKDAV